MSSKISIIGSRDLHCSITFKDMVDMTKKEILKLVPDGNCELISGGSSWADFIAVVLKNELPNSSLTLYLPADFSIEFSKFIPTQNDNGAGLTLNKLHGNFKLQTGISSLELMASTAKLDKVKYITHVGFLNRNNYIASECDHLIALSNGVSCPDTPGTLYTWNKAKNKNRIHLHINT